MQKFSTHVLITTLFFLTFVSSQLNLTSEFHYNVSVSLPSYLTVKEKSEQCNDDRKFDATRQEGSCRVYL